MLRRSVVHALDTMLLPKHVPYKPATGRIMAKAAILCSQTGYLLLLMQGQQQQRTPSPGCKLQRRDLEHTHRSK